MLIPLLFFVLIGSMGLLAALRPDMYIRTFLAESQRRALSGNLRSASLTGWVIFGGCALTVIALSVGDRLQAFTPVVSPMLFLACAAAYLWWGVALLRRPESFLRRAVEPWSRIPVWVVKALGVVLLAGACGFSYGFAAKIISHMR
jgi:hypothetical protein